MRKIFILFLLLLFSSNLFAVINLSLSRGESRNIEFNNDIDMCSSIYNTIDFICGRNNVLINIKDSNNIDRILVIFTNGTQELINVRRKISDRRIERNFKNKIDKRNPDKFRAFYQYNYAERIGNQNFFQKRHLLSIDNEIGELFWNINLTKLENTFTQNTQASERVFFNTTLRYRKVKFYFGNTSLAPLRGSPLMNARIYGGDLLYKDRDFFVNVKSGKLGIQYQIIDKRLDSISIGKEVYKGIYPAISYAQNTTDNIKIYGLNTNIDLLKNTSLQFVISEASDEEDRKNTYSFNFNIRNILKNDLFRWRSSNLSSNISPEGIIFITGNKTNVNQSNYTLSNNFNIYIPKKYGILQYQNSYNSNKISNLETYSLNNSFSYAYDKFTYSFRYSLIGRSNSDFRSERMGNSIKYHHNTKTYDHIFGVFYNTTKTNENSINYATGATYSLLGNSFSWNNTILMGQQVLTGFSSNNFRDNINRRYSLTSNISFKDQLSLDNLRLGFQSVYMEDETDQLYNSLNSVKLSMTKEFLKNHRLSLDLRYGANYTYDGTKEFANFALTYTYMFKTKHNVINSIIYDRDMTIEIYQDLNYNNKIDKEDSLIDGVIAQVYSIDGTKFGEYTIRNGKIKLKGIDKRQKYFVSLKGDKYEMIQPNFSYERNEGLFAQSFYSGIVDIRDILNDERVSSAELTVRCLNYNYTRKFTATSTDNYNLKYPQNSQCLLLIEPVVSESYYDIEYNDILPQENNFSVLIKLKRYSKLYGYIKDKKGKAISGKKINFMGQSTQSDEFGYYEMKFKKGEVFKVDVKKDIINKSRSLKGCSSSSNFISFSLDYLLEKEVNFNCKKK